MTETDLQEIEDILRYGTPRDEVMNEWVVRLLIAMLREFRGKQEILRS